MSKSSKKKLNPPSPAQAEIRVRVTPRSSKNRITGKEGDIYRVKVTSPPVDGLANSALIDLLANKLGVSKASVQIRSGRGARLKSLLISGLSSMEARARLDREVG